MRAKFGEFVAELGRLYRSSSSFWRRDHDPGGFAWIDVHDRENSVISYLRRDGDEHMIVVLNLTPVPREQYRIGCPSVGVYEERLSSDDARFGGSGHVPAHRVASEPVPFHGYAQSIAVTLPPLGALVLAPVEAEALPSSRDAKET